MKHWHIDEVAWDRFDPAKADPELIPLVKADAMEERNGTDYEPDAVVNCGPPASPDAIAAANPVVVVEVLAPGTKSIDTSDKLAGYFRLASVQHYLVVSTRRSEVIHHRREGGAIVSHVVSVGAIELDPPGITIDIGELYPLQR